MSRVRGVVQVETLKGLLYAVLLLSYYLCNRAGRLLCHCFVTWILSHATDVLWRIRAGASSKYRILRP